MKLFFGKGMPIMITTVLLSWITMKLQFIFGGETQFAIQTVLLITAWTAGLLGTGCAIFCRPADKGIGGFIAKLAAVAIAAAETLAAVWVIAYFAGLAV